MPNRDPLTETNPAETPLGPQTTPGVPDRSQEKPATPPIKKPEDNRNPNDPALLPIGDPAGAA